MKLVKIGNKDDAVLYGEDRGLEEKEKCGLSEVEKEDSVTVLMPNGLWGMSVTFFRGMFKDSVKMFGTEFFDRYSFLHKNLEKPGRILSENIKENYDLIMREIAEEEDS